MLVTAMGTLQMTCRAEPLLGTLPTGQVNAMAIRVPGTDEFIVAFEQGLLAFLPMISKAIVQALPFDNAGARGFSFSVDRAKARDATVANDSARERFRAALFAYLFEGHPALAPSPMLEMPHSLLHRIILTELELFILAHEYGHLLHGHLDPSQIRRPALIKGVEVEQVSRSHIQEFEADQTGMCLALQALATDGIAPSVTFAAIDLFFSVDYALEQALMIITTGKRGVRGTDSHPHPCIRRERLRHAVQSFCGQAYESKSMLHLAETFELIAHLLFEDLVPRLNEAHSQGRRLAKIWGT